MALFSKKCPSCGHANSPQAGFCAQCGTPMGGGEVICGACNTSNRSDSRYCKKCGRDLSANAAPEIRDQRWARREGEFAVRIEADDLPGLLRRGIAVQMGTNAMLVEDGANRGVLGPGQHTLDSLDERLLNWISLARNKKVSVLLVDVNPAELEFNLGGIFTNDPIGIGLSLHLQTRIEEPARFLVQMLASRERYSLEDLRVYLYPEVARVAETWIGQHSVQELAEDLSLKDKLELALEEALKPTLARLGLKFIDVRTLDLNLEHLDRIKGVRSRYSLQITEAEAEAQGKQRLVDVMKQLNLQKLAEETARVEDEENRAELFKRMRYAVMSGKMDEARSEADFDTFLDDMDRKKLLREKERVDLLRTWKEEAEDHELSRGYLVEKLRIEQDYQTKKVALTSQGDLDQTRLDNEITLARKRADFEFEQKRKIVEGEFLLERERQRIEDEKIKAGIEIEHLQHQQELADDVDAAKAGIELLDAMKKVRRLDEEERLRIQRVHEFEMKKTDLEIELKRFEIAERARDSEREHELKRMEVLGHLGAEALISVSGAEQSKILAGLKKTEALKGMTEEQILAAAAAESPDVAHALQEKFRAMAEGQLSGREAKLYERLMAGNKDELARVNDMWLKLSEREKSTAEHAMDKLADVAQSFARGQGGTPVVITDSSGSRVISSTGGRTDGDSTEGSKNCPKCGRFVLADAHFCQYCGNKFEGVS